MTTQFHLFCLIVNNETLSTALLKSLADLSPKKHGSHDNNYLTLKNNVKVFKPLVLLSTASDTTPSMIRNDKKQTPLLK